ncbi:MAG: 1,4-alpha-glucan branching protein GlgB [Bacilli bacterium]|nr:1,4-alpha-glucan branching protein GlgB [Bacilli bacterium]
MFNKFLYDFHNNYSSEAYNYLGSFYHNDYTIFRVFAPHADSISVVGDFNNWDSSKNVMEKIDFQGVWELKIPSMKIFDNYKYCIFKDGRSFLKQDPYSYHNQTDGQSASKVYQLGNYQWNDALWLDSRNKKNLYKTPMNIYEVHIGSWIRKKKNVVYNYRDIADKLIKYVKKMGYNYIELLPVMEHPFLGSWGYQVTGYFSVTSRYGTPDDFMYLIDLAHQNDIGVILDWVPAHFCKDDFGLYEFDGRCLYEDPAPTRKEHSGWGTRIFNFAKPEVKSFLISSACFFFDKYHIDGIRCDAVASMLYLSYDRTEWEPNYYGGSENLEAIGFLKDLNQTVFRRFGNILMIAEESTTFPKITEPVHEGGLGFNYKWNMGWMNDTLDYVENDPIYRQYHHHKMTFAMSYAFTENFVLPISHDEVVHGKKSLLDKMPGNYDDKFNNLRTYLGYMMTHPGKKLLFMGCEFGHFIEWDEEKQLDWFLLKYPRHKEMQVFSRDLNKYYLKHPQLYEFERSWDGFEWIYANSDSSNSYVYLRKSSNKKHLIVLLNFSGQDYYKYKIYHNQINGSYKIAICSNAIKYGGTGFGEFSDNGIKIIKADNGSIEVDLPRLSMIILEKK